MPKIWFTSDTHFGQERTLELSRRPFRSVEDMNREMCENWNICVSNEDEVYHLGDFGDPAYLRRLNGKRIRILPGNYDTRDILEQLCWDQRVEIIGPNPQVLVFPPDVGLPNMKIIHEPEKADDPESFYLFGHIHKLQMVKKNGLNVGVDCHDFKPIDFEVIKFYYEAITKHYDENVFVPCLGYAFEA